MTSSFGQSEDFECAGSFSRLDLRKTKIQGGQKEGTQDREPIHKRAAYTNCLSKVALLAPRPAIRIRQFILTTVLMSAFRSASHRANNVLFVRHKQRTPSPKRIPSQNVAPYVALCSTLCSTLDLDFV
jgi:hypothetical protein